MTASPVVEMRGIGKRFPGVVALDGVDFRSGPAKSMRSWARTARANPP